MTRPVKVFRLRRRDIAKVVSLGLAQVATLLAFLFLTALVVNALTVDAVGAAEVASDHRTMLELGGLVCLAFLHGWLLNAEFSVSEKVGYNVVRDLRMQMYDHLLGMTGHELLHRARGGLLLRFIGDLSMLRMWISRGLLGGSVAVIVVVGTLVPLTIVDPWIGISMAAVLSCGAAISLTNGKRMRSATRTMRRRRSLVTGVIDEQINALEVVQVSGRAPGEHSRLSRQNVMLNRSLCRVAELRGRLREYRRRHGPADLGRRARCRARGSAPRLRLGRAGRGGGQRDATARRTGPHARTRARPTGIGHRSHKERFSTSSGAPVEDWLLRGSNGSRSAVARSSSGT